MNVSSNNQAVKLETDVALSLFEGCDTPISLSCYLLLKYGEHNALLEKRIQPSDYNDQRKFALDWQCVHLLSKSKNLGSFDPDASAFQKYLEAEDKCRETNERILSNDSETSLLLDKVGRWCRRILGFLSKNDLDYVENNCRFGPGSSTGTSGPTTYSQKISNDQQHVSPRLLPFALHCLPQMWRQLKPEFVLRRSSKGCIVPKNSKTSRCIEIQPDLNVYVQLGIGSILRKRLKRYGVDLSDQGINQRLAQKGSIDDSLATFDLSSASDTISLALVRSVIPSDWLHLLELARVDLAEWPDRTILLEKWSAMGNGYTFELETLIFYALLLAVCDDFGYGYDQISAYGDDLIFPSEFASAVTKALDLCGFSVNLNKSFGKGPFRESCGADFWNGINVRPIFFKASLTEKLFHEICYHYGNQIRVWGRRLNGDLGCDILALGSWLRCFTSCPPSLRVRVPLGCDDGFVSNFDEARPTLIRSHGWGGFRFRRIVRRDITRRSYLGSYYSTLAGQSNKDPFYDREVVPRLRGKPYSRPGYVLTWPDLGPWV